MSKISIGVLGCGNMAEAIVLGLHHQFSQFEFHTYTPSFVRAKALATKVGGSAHKEIENLRACEVYLIGCKPQQFTQLCQNFSSYAPKEALYISIMASIPLEKISAGLGVKRAVRVMPNTASLLGEGVSLVCFSSKVLDEEKKLVQHMFASIGEVFQIDSEGQMDQVTGVSSSGLAYLFELARIQQKYLIDVGFPSDKARHLLAQLFVGAGMMLEAAEDDVQALRDKVTSKKGITQAALEELQKGELETLWRQALQRAAERARELSNV